MLAPCYFKGLRHTLECGANPFLRPTLVLSHSCPTKLSLLVIHQRLFSSIYTPVAALAASFFHVGRDRREASDVMPELSLSFPLPPFLRISGNSNGHQSEPIMPPIGRRYFHRFRRTRVHRSAKLERMVGWKKSENLKIVQLARVSTVFSIQNDQILHPEEVRPRGQLNHLAKRSAHGAKGLANGAIYRTHSANVATCPIYKPYHGEIAVQCFGNLDHYVSDKPLCFDVQQLLVMNHARYDSRCILYALNRALNAVSHVVRKRGQRTKPLQLVVLKVLRVPTYCIHMLRQYVVLFLIITVEVRHG